MPLQVHVHAMIWEGHELVVHRRRARGREHVTLPGGRVKDRESVIGALRREVREEIGHDIVVDDLVFVGEVSAATRQDVVLIFAARLTSASGRENLHLLDPAGPEAPMVLPPILDRLPGRSARLEPPRLWLGNLYIPQPS